MIWRYGLIEYRHAEDYPDAGVMAGDVDCVYPLVLQV